jgi:hypothetical protein
MIVNKDLNSADPTLKKWMTAIRYLHMAKRSAPSSAKNLIPPLPIDSLQRTQLAPTFDPRTVHHLNRIMGNLHITTLRERADLLSEILERELKVSITGTALSTVFGRKRSWAHGMTAEHLHALDFPDPVHPGRPGLVDYTLEDEPVRSSVLPLKQITLIRTMSTIIKMIHALIMIDGDIPLNRISTHPLENFLGLLRRILHDCKKFDEFLHGVARNVIVSEIFHELGYPCDICDRENQGGVVNWTSGKAIPDPKFTAAEAVEQIWVTLPLGASPHTYVSSEDAEKIDKVMAWLEKIERVTSTKQIICDGHFTIRATANSKIMASLLQGRPSRPWR